MLKKTGVQIPQLFIVLFLTLMVFLALRLDIPLNWIASDALVRLVMNGVLVLSLVPMLKAGIGINFGLPVGIVAGLLGLCMSVNFKLDGIAGLFAGMLFAVPFATILGGVYAAILNRVKGKEEITATFVGFAFIPLMNFFWTVAPFTNPVMLWPIGGKGLRPVIGLKGYFEKALNHLWLVDICTVKVPVGMILFFFRALFSPVLLLQDQFRQDPNRRGRERGIRQACRDQYLPRQGNRHNRFDTDRRHRNLCLRPELRVYRTL
jgi:simple sugar transport system permease protein